MLQASKLGPDVVSALTRARRHLPLPAAAHQYGGRGECTTEHEDIELAVRTRDDVQAVAEFAAKHMSAHGCPCTA